MVAPAAFLLEASLEVRQMTIYPMHDGKCTHQETYYWLTDLLALTTGECLVQEKGYVTADVAKEQDLHQLKLSGTKFRQMLRSGADIPEWFAFKSVVDVLREATPTK